MKRLFISLLYFHVLIVFILFSRESFSQCTVAGYYSLVGAATSSPPYNCVSLTSDQPSQSGCAWYNIPILNFGFDFSYDFTVNLGTKDAYGADGITFVVQNDPRGLCACGSLGGNLGADGITNSLIIEIDTYMNDHDRDDSMPSVLCSGGQEPDHLDIWANGNLNPSGTGCPGVAGARIIPNAIELKDGAALYNIENGSDHILRISWVAGAPGTMTASVMNTALTTTYGTVSYTFDPLTLFGTNTPYFGFTAATGGLSNLQYFCSISPALLPVELSELRAICNNNKVELHWTTASETNNSYFTIERGNNQDDFYPIAQINGTGNSVTAHSYTWVDENPLNEVAYYRLRQTDYDGKTKTSASVSIAVCPHNDIPVKIHPNPFTDEFNISFSLNKNASVTIKLSNVYGQEIKTIATNEQKEKERCSYMVGAGNIAAGVYYLTIMIDDFVVIKKVIRN